MSCLCEMHVTNATCVTCIYCASAYHVHVHPICVVRFRMTQSPGSRNAGTFLCSFAGEITLRSKSLLASSRTPRFWDSRSADRAQRRPPRERRCRPGQRKIGEAAGGAARGGRPRSLLPTPPGASAPRILAEPPGVMGRGLGRAAASSHQELCTYLAQTPANTSFLRVLFSRAGRLTAQPGRAGQLQPRLLFQAGRTGALALRPPACGRCLDQDILNSDSPGSNFWGGTRM